MNLKITKLKPNSSIITELENWVEYENSQSLNEFILNDGANTFDILINRHLSNEFATNYALLFAFCSKPVGLALLSTFINHINGQHICTIDYLCVNPQNQNHSIGLQMLKDILSNKGNYIKDHNIDWFMAKISHKNIPSQKLFKKAGFDIDIEGNEVLAFKNTQKEFGR